MRVGNDVTAVIPDPARTARRERRNESAAALQVLRAHMHDARFNESGDGAIGAVDLLENRLAVRLTTNLRRAYALLARTRARLITQWIARSFKRDSILHQRIESRVLPEHKCRLRDLHLRLFIVHAPHHHRRQHQGRASCDQNRNARAEIWEVLHGVTVCCWLRDQISRRRAPPQRLFLLPVEPVAVRTSPRMISVELQAQSIKPARSFGKTLPAVRRRACTDGRPKRRSARDPSMYRPSRRAPCPCS